MKEENSIRMERVVRTLVHSTSIIHVFPLNIIKVWSVQIGTKKEPIINFYFATVNHNQTWLISDKIIDELECLDNADKKRESYASKRQLSIA